MKKGFLLALFILGLSTLKSEEVMACSCFGDIPVRIKIESSEMVFIGKAEKIEDSVVEFDLSEVIKGPKTENLELQRDQGSCDYFFEKGKEYLVYTHRDETGELTTSLCSGNSLVSEAAKEIRIIKGEAKWYDIRPQAVFAFLFSVILVVCFIKLILNSRSKKK